jgi:hypothetical protein
LKSPALAVPEALMLKQTRTRKLWSFWLTVGICLSVSIGCRLFSKTNMFEGTAATDAVEAFRKKVGGPIKALSVEIEKDGMTLKAQDPKNPENVDEYKYVKGFVTGPTPVRLNLLEKNIDQTLFNLDEIDLAATARVATTALERAQIEGGKIKKMTIERTLSIATGMTKSGNVRWTIEIEGTRESASAVADGKGNILGLDLSQTARAAQFSTYSADTLREAAPRIKEAFGGKVTLLEVTIYDKYLWFQAKSPKDGEITQYKYDINGVTSSELSNLGDPTPIEVRTRQFKIEELYFDLDDVNLAMAPELGKKACARLNLSDGKVSLYKIERRPQRKFLSKELITRWSVSCQQGRKSGYVDYDTTGNELYAHGP